MVDAEECSSDETSGESEGALMAKRETKAQWVPPEDKHKREMEEFDVLTTNDLSDSEDPDPKCIISLQGGAKQYIEELARQIHRCCSDKKWNSYQRRLACELLVKLAIRSTNSIYRLAEEFPEPFREIAEELPHFPCLFPAHAERLRIVQKLILDGFNLGKRHTLKLRHAPGRKTFSTKTWVNSLLIRLIELVHESARREDDELGPLWDDEGTSFQRVAYCVPLNPDPKNVKEWLDAIWKLLLTEIPEPEKHPRLRQLGGRPSKVHDVRATIKAKLGTYLERMLNDQAVHR
jgi:hypothetical protein